MAITINADTTNGLVMTPDTSGEINFQSAGVTVGSVTSNGFQDVNGNALSGYAGPKNLIINGNMQIAQRATSTASITGSGFHTIDRFYTTLSSLGTWTHSQDTDVPSGQGFAKSYKMQCTTADASPAASDYKIWSHKIEAQMLQHLKYGTSSAEKLTVTFWVKSNKTATYILEFQQPDADRISSNAFTINSADTWEKKTITIDGDTSGTINNDNGSGLELNFWFGAGTTFTSGTLSSTWASKVSANRCVGISNLADSTSNYINITGVQLEVGSNATNFEHIPYDMNLARCQRYYQVVALKMYQYCNLTASAQCQWFVPARATPTVTRISGNSQNVSIDVGPENADWIGCRYTVTASSAGVAGYYNGSLSVNAEL